MPRLFAILTSTLCLCVAVGTQVPHSPPSPMGNFSTQSDYFYVGGFKAGGVQDAYLVYPTSGAGPFPMVAFAHGAFKHTPNDTAQDYAAILEHVASQGIVVAAFNDCLFECNTSLYSGDQLHLVAALRDNLGLHPVLTKVDFSRVALMGHSMGGAATIASAGQGMEGVVAAAAIHPHAIPLPVRPGDASQVKVPMFYMCGEKDPVVPCPGVKEMYNQTPTTKKVFAELQGAGHTEIQKPLPGGRWDFYIVEFMRCHLMEDQPACDNIYGTSQDALCTAGLMVDCQHSQPAPLVVV